MWLDRGVFSVQPVSLMSNAGFSELRAGHAAAALKLAQGERVADERAGNLQTMALADLLASRAALALGRPGESSRHLEAAEAYWNTNAKGNARMLLESTLHRAELQLAAGSDLDARDRAEAALQSLGYPDRMSAAGLDRVLRLSARTLLRTGNPAKAVDRASSALEVSKRVARDERKSADVEAALLRAQAYAALDRPVDALADARLAVEALRNGLGSDHATTSSAEALVATLSSTGKGRR